MTEVNINSWHFKMLPADERIMLRSEWQGPCLVFTGQQSPDGYGMIRINRRHQMVHRYMWQTLVGPIPDDMQLDHLCRNEACWWSDHLRIVTAKVNTLASYNPASMNSKRTHCIYGHEFTDANTYRNGGRRSCRQCNNRRTRERYRQRVEAVVDEQSGEAY